MRFSIITVCYNNKEGLEKTIKSVINQTYNDYEFIVIDGGSNDGTKELLEIYDNKIDFWCSEPDDGIFNAMNKGTKKAKGEYLLFLNSGDLFFNNYVLENISTHNCLSDIISGYSIEMGSNKYLHPHMDDIVFQLLTNSISHQATFIKKDLLIKYPYDESFKTASDWKFWLEAIIINNCSFEFINTKVSLQDMTGITTSQNNMVLQEGERTFIRDSLFPKKLCQSLINNHRKSNEETALNALYLKNKHKHIYTFTRRFVKLITLITKKYDSRYDSCKHIDTGLQS